jgi:hypothetical protein
MGPSSSAKGGTFEVGVTGRNLISFSKDKLGKRRQLEKLEAPKEAQSDNEARERKQSGNAQPREESFETEGRAAGKGVVSRNGGDVRKKAGSEEMSRCRLNSVEKCTPGVAILK